MQLIVTEKRKFNYVVLSLLIAAVAVWTVRVVQAGGLILPF